MSGVSGNDHKAETWLIKESKVTGQVIECAAHPCRIQGSPILT